MTLAWSGRDSLTFPIDRNSIITQESNCAKQKSKMKTNLKSVLLGLAGVCFLASQARGAVTLESGSLAVAFYQVIGGVVQPNTYIFDLGQASNYRENTGYNVSVSTITGGPASSSIAGDLTNTFGANWANDGTVRWMVIGNVGQTDPTVDGDPAYTSYLSRAVSTIPAGGVSTTIPTISLGNRGFLSNNIESVFNNVSNATSGASADGTIIGKAAPGTIDEFLPPTTGTYFGIGVNPYQTLNAGSITNNSAAQSLGLIEGALDIYRVLDTTGSGADLTAGYSIGDAIVGKGQYIGTLVLSSTGNLSVIPESSTALLGVASTLGLCFRRRRNA